jgi:hypothetical protein
MAEQQETPLDELKEKFLYTKSLHTAMNSIARDQKVVPISGEAKEPDDRTLGDFVGDGLVIRSEEELLRAEEKLEIQLWHGRHKGLEASGNLNITPEQLKEVEKVCEKFEARFPGELGPYTEYEWGELSGKVSAIRWVLGDDWGNLAT